MNRFGFVCVFVCFLVMVSWNTGVITGCALHVNGPNAGEFSSQESSTEVTIAPIEITPEPVFDASPSEPLPEQPPEEVAVEEPSQEQPPEVSELGVVTTFAGSGEIGFNDGVGNQAQFYYPHGVAVDKNGNVYVADLSNHRIRKIDTSGNVTTIAGSGVRGSKDGVGDQAQFKGPTGVAVDKNGNVYVADLSNHSIRKIDTSGNVTTIAGSTEGFRDGVGNQAQFSVPAAVAVDSNGNVYVADTSNHSIRKIDTSGNVTTIAGNGMPGFKDGVGNQAQFSVPNGVAVDSKGNVYIADLNNHKIRKIDTSGNVTTITGGRSGFKDGVGNQAQFSDPNGVAVDSKGNIYVADLSNHRIRKIDISGNVTTIAGDGTSGSRDGIASQAQFATPLGVAVDSNGNVYVTDQSSSTVRKITQPQR